MPDITIAIVTYNREQVLIDTITSMLEQTGDCETYKEMIIVDQTEKHQVSVNQRLENWSKSGHIRWIRLPEANLTGAMNRALAEAKTDIVLYVDDDVIPSSNLLSNHLKAYAKSTNIACVIGQVLQPGETAEEIDYQPSGSFLKRYLDFPFRNTRSGYIENAIGCNMSIHRKTALDASGFDENFKPPVATRFETEYVKRLALGRKKTWFEASASLHHLAAKSGGTRSKGGHLNSASPRYGVGDYYYAMKHGTKWTCFQYCLIRFFREVRTKFHLRHPWYIPVKLVGEARAILMAYQLSRKRNLLSQAPKNT